MISSDNGLMRALMVSGLVLTLGGCTSEDAEDGAGQPMADAGAEGSADAGAEGSVADAGGSGDPHQLSHTFPAIELEPGAEIGAGIDGPCQAWTLGNEETLWVNRIEARNDGGWHHSNWFLVEEGSLSVPDGTFHCADEGIVAPVGQIFFAQTTQALADEQAFGDGIAFEVPPHSVVVGQMHMLNVAEAPMSTTFSFDVHTIAADEVTVPLRSSTLSVQSLKLPAAVESEAVMTCVLPASMRGEALYYVLPHYHAMGRRLFIETTYADGSTALLFEGFGYGEASGELLVDAPLLGESVRMGCEYENTSEREISWGFMGSDEMCVALLYTTSEARLFGSDLLGNCGFLPM